MRRKSKAGGTSDGGGNRTLLKVHCAFEIRDGPTGGRLIINPCEGSKFEAT